MTKTNPHVRYRTLLAVPLLAITLGPAMLVAAPPQATTSSVETGTDATTTGTGGEGVGSEAHQTGEPASEAPEVVPEAAPVVVDPPKAPVAEKKPEEETPEVPRVVNLPELPDLVDPQAVADRLARLELLTRGIEKLVTGELPEGLSLPEIFEIDILDPQAVERRRTQLSEQITAIDTRIGELKAEPKPEPTGGNTVPRGVDPVNNGEVGSDSEASPPAKPVEPGGEPQESPGPLGAEWGADDGSVPKNVGTQNPATTHEEASTPVLSRAESERKLLSAEKKFARGRLTFLMLSPDTRRDLFTRDQSRRDAEHAVELATDKLGEAELVRKQAEEERLVALREAEEASSEKQRELAEARAAAEGLRRDLADLNANLSTAEARFHTAIARNDDPVTLLLARAERAIATPNGRDLVKLFDELTAASNTTREQLADVLEKAESEPPTPRHDIELPVIPDDDVALSEERDRLVALLEQLETDAELYVERAVALAHLQLADTFFRESELNRAIISMLDLLPAEKRAVVLGFGPEGIAQLRREVTHLGLAIRWYRLRQRKLPEDIVERLRDTYTLIEVVSTGAQILGLLLVAIVFIRRRKSLFERLRANLVRVLRRAWLVRPLQVSLAAATHLTPGLILLITLTLIWRRVGDLHEVIELRILYESLFAYTFYRLCLTATHRGVSWLIRRRMGPRSEKFHLRLYRSLRLIGRTVLLVVVVLTTSRHVLGTGHLYRMVSGFAWLGSIPIALFLIRRWQDDIASGYLSYRDRGALADAVRSTRTHWYGFFVALAAVVILFVVGTWRLVQGFILGFDQSRRALAFFFRRRLERHANEASQVAMANELPNDLIRALRLDATADARLIVDHFPRLTDFHTQFDTWSECHHLVGATLVVADSGYGKTSWLKAVRRVIEHEPVHLIRLERRLLSQRQVLQCIARELEVPEANASSLTTLVSWLRSGPRRVVMVDD
ncbi:MAG: hypothetical protein ACPG4T_01435, partial [Nannocystaceae bacterium]